MSIYVSGADGYNGATRSYGRQQIRRCSGRDSVMSPFQQHRLRMLLNQPLLRRTLSVSLQQSSRRAKGSCKYEAVVVRAHGTGPLISPRSKHLEVHSTVVELVAFLSYKNLHS